MHDLKTSIFLWIIYNIWKPKISIDKYLNMDIIKMLTLTPSRAGVQLAGFMSRRSKVRILPRQPWAKRSIERYERSATKLHMRTLYSVSHMKTIQYRWTLPTVYTVETSGLMAKAWDRFDLSGRTDKTAQGTGHQPGNGTISETVYRSEDSRRPVGDALSRWGLNGSTALWGWRTCPLEAIIQ